MREAEARTGTARTVASSVSASRRTMSGLPGVVAGAARTGAWSRWCWAPSSWWRRCSSGSGCWSPGCWRTAPLHRDEIAFEHDVLAHRTPVLERTSPSFGTLLGATETVIALTAVGCLVLAWRGHGPRLPVFLALAVAGETALFVLASLVIDRLRPAIPHLDGAPPTSSFPSGHTAATRRAVVRPRPGPGAHPSAAIRCGCSAGSSRWRCPAFVLVSRLYRGMHWPTDVAASVVFTLLWLLLLRAVLLPPDAADRPPPLRR